MTTARRLELATRLANSHPWFHGWVHYGDIVTEAYGLRLKEEREAREVRGPTTQALPEEEDRSIQALVPQRAVAEGHPDAYEGRLVYEMRMPVPEEPGMNQMCACGRWHSRKEECNWW